MAKVKTASQVQDRLDDEFAWRLKEIHELRSAVKTSGAIRETILIRAAIPILYAHWEGFIKRSSEVYIEYVAHQKHSYKDLKTCFIVHGVKKKVDELSESSNFTKNQEIVDFLLEELNNSATIPYKSIIDAKSNLNSNVFKDILNSVGLNHESYDMRFNFIDYAIVDKRNNIAHGRKVDVDISRFFEISKNLISLLRQFKNDIENAVVRNQYKRD